MLKTNKVLFLIRKNLKKSFFIILIWVKQPKKKALKLALDQHPKSTGLKLVQVEMLVYDEN
jgi:hypothetical protein